MARKFILAMVWAVGLLTVALPAYLWIAQPEYLHSLDALDSVSPFENPLTNAGTVIQPVELLKRDAELQEIKKQLAALEKKGEVTW